MVSSRDVYLEIGSKRAFAASFDWPGWCRSGRDGEAALRALVEAGPRYARSLGRAATGFSPPAKATALRVSERVNGGATTDFGAPEAETERDLADLTPREADRLAGLLQACWRAFDRAARKAVGVELRKGPRGGGRDLDAIVDHVRSAEGAYLSKLGARADDGSMEAVRRTFIDVFSDRARGEPPPRTPRSGRLWTPPYAVRRSAWHAIDHTWEIEDRSAP
ncbi:MAG TPA: hypothetical protein VGB19_03675 [Actinomycetota bacterium]